MQCSQYDESLTDWYTNDNGANVGACYVYGDRGPGWELTAYVKPRMPADGLGFPDSAALSANGRTIVLGHDDEVYVYE